MLPLKNNVKVIFSDSMTDAANGGVLWKKLYIKISQYSQENSCVGISVLIKFLNKISLLKRYYNAGFFLWIFQKNFHEHQFWRTSVNKCFWYNNLLLHEALMNWFFGWFLTKSLENLLSEVHTKLKYLLKVFHDCLENFRRCS